MKSAKILIIMTTYNGSNYVVEQLDSIMMQSVSNFDLLVSDDHSSDGTWSLLKKAAKQNARISLRQPAIRQGNAGKHFIEVIVNENISSYDYILFSDQDDIWDQDKIERALDIMCFKNVHAYSSNVTAFWEDGNTKLLLKSQQQRKYDYLFEAAGPGCTYCVDKSVIHAFKDYLADIDLDKIMLHDWLIYGFCRIRGFSWWIDDKSVLLYRQHSSNVIGSGASFAAKIRRMQMLRSGRVFQQLRELINHLQPDMSDKISSRWWLLRNVKHLRRRKRDRYILFILILIGLINV